MALRVQNIFSSAATVTTSKYGGNHSEERWAVDSQGRKQPKLRRQISVFVRVMMVLESE